MIFEIFVEFVVLFYIQSHAHNDLSTTATVSKTKEDAF